jgi:Na+/melibiose symporter-like transporter
MDTVTSRQATTASAWENRPFRWLWTGSAVSMFGAEIAEMAIPLLALLTLSAGADELATLRAAQFLPFLLATLPIGLVVDRQRRRPLMVGADLGRCALVALIPLAVWFGFASMGLLYGIVFVAGILTVLYQVADFAFLPLVVDADRLPDANAKIVATQSAMEIGGRGLGGLLVQAVTAPVAVAVNAVSYLLSAVSISRVPTDQPPPPAEHRAPLREALEGIKVAVGNRYLRALAGEATTFNLCNEIFMIGLMLYVVRDLGIPAAGLGAILTAGGVGSFAGAWFGTRVAGRWGYGPVLLTTLITGNTAPVATAAAEGAWAGPLLGAVFFVMGVGIGIANAHAVTVRQVATEPRLRGRVNAAYRLMSWGALPVGAAAGGVVATQVGAYTTMVTGAIGIASATLWVLFSPVPRLRRATDAAHL